ncbi:hypothetical protein IQ07DRAFT_220726 [Pyrenochaeta sp. DS3sAY3a]|nr:hypothetical protein IQ07DRAFT_220726 [Pyrenochaeta sp. DS3sAY3a]
MPNLIFPLSLLFLFRPFFPERCVITLVSLGSPPCKHPKKRRATKEYSSHLPKRQNQSPLTAEKQNSRTHTQPHSLTQSSNKTLPSKNKKKRSSTAQQHALQKPQKQHVRHKPPRPHVLYAHPPSGRCPPRTPPATSPVRTSQSRCCDSRSATAGDTLHMHTHGRRGDQVGSFSVERWGLSASMSGRGGDSNLVRDEVEWESCPKILVVYILCQFKG